MRFIFVLVGVLCFTLHSQAQDAPKDSTTTVVDSIYVKKDGEIVPIESYAKKYDPHKAILLSAVLPGAGQFYNRKYWKIPLVYGGFASLLAVVIFEQKLEVKYRAEYFSIVGLPTGTTSASGYTIDQLKNIVNQTRRQRDYFTIFTAMFYMLQMVDAHVDAHLKEFDLNPKLQVKVDPVMQYDILTGRSAGVALTFKF
jgi:hypothetical protein